MANPLGESKPSALRLDFDRRLMLQFRDPLVLAMLDCWSMVYRELDDALGLTGLAGEMRCRRECCWNSGDVVTGDMRVSSQAARSIG
jgi:hypothetical protein